ncbi:MAG: ATP synthase F1 subunit epsilon [Paludibacter sp.]
MKLEIVSPEKVYFSGDVALVTLPGKSGQFTILENHAPIISLLSKGSVIYKKDAVEQTLEIESGFAEVNNNSIVVCIEYAK